ncbi:MAG TPA: hypothetical protein VGI03_09920 [Verrucomicrobiae bacterium]|jgi:hypothetical protein
MNAAAPDLAGNGHLHPAKGWSRGQLFRMVVVVFIAHVVLIFIFGARKPIIARAVKDVPQLEMAAAQNEWLTLDDPALFALPHADPYNAPYQVTNSFHWSNATHWLSLTDIVGGVTSGLGQPYHFSTAHLEFIPPVKLDVPATQFRPEFAQASTLRVDGDLARRPWIAAPRLPLWIDNDVLQPAVVQVLVNPEGDVASEVLLPPGSGLDAADQKALEIARGLHFVRAAHPTFGNLTFNWQTAPAPETNAPAISP